MAEAEYVNIICPNCSALIATVPENRPLKTDGLICSNCGAELRTSSPLERAVEKVTFAVEKAEDAIEKGLSGKGGARE
jgi:DNA-directed RNA polymerase subunit M/transcription elongation factor TFIIS